MSSNTQTLKAQTTLVRLVDLLYNLLRNKSETYSQQIEPVESEPKIDYRIPRAGCVVIASIKLNRSIHCRHRHELNITGKKHKNSIMLALFPKKYDAVNIHYRNGVNNIVC